MAPSQLNFKVTIRHQPKLITPAEPTPYGWKQLSDIDDQGGLRLLMKGIWFYPANTSMAGIDPAEAIRRGLSKAMVYYYPYAGRIREGPNKKLNLECTGEGILFVEADADVRLSQFGEALHPPFPGLDELLYDVPGSARVVDSPVMLVQVTRLACGGFVVAVRHNHVISDAPGMGMFLSAAAEMARGAAAPSVFPAWERERLCARNPPRVTCVHREFDPVPVPDAPSDAPAHDSLFFRNADVTALRAQLPHHLRKAASTFDILTACLWKCRTAALQTPAEEDARLIIAINTRSMFYPPLSKGFYGNAVSLPGVVTTAGRLCRNRLGYAVELVRKVKAKVSEEYMRSTADLLVQTGRPHYTVAKTYLVSDIRYSGFKGLDWGWGDASYGGPADEGEEMISYLVAFKNRNGEEGILVPICLPVPAMGRLKLEVKKMLSQQPLIDEEKPQEMIISAL